MHHIIHDWDDDESLTILRNCRKAMGQGGKLLVIEECSTWQRAIHQQVLRLGDDGAARWNGTDGRGIRQLFEASGFRLTRLSRRRHG